MLDIVVILSPDATRTCSVPASSTSGSTNARGAGTGPTNNVLNAAGIRRWVSGAQMPVTLGELATTRDAATRSLITCACATAFATIIPAIAVQ